MSCANEIGCLSSEVILPKTPSYSFKSYTFHHTADRQLTEISGKARLADSCFCR